MQESSNTNSLNHGSPLPAKCEEMDIVLLRELKCKRCQQFFYICQCCYHGQQYCCVVCRDAARSEAHRISQSLYRTSDPGRKMNREAANRRRNNKKNDADIKNVADHCTTPPPLTVTLLPVPSNKIPSCCKCGAIGRVVTEFPSRGYGNRPRRSFSVSNPVAQ